MMWLNDIFDLVTKLTAVSDGFTVFSSMKLWSMSKPAEPVFRGVGVGELCELRSWPNWCAAFISSSLASKMTDVGV